MTYFAELCRAMSLVAQYPAAIFMGQGVARHGGTSMSQTFAGVPEAKLLEIPVAEDMQMGMATGMAIGGLLPICAFPRWNFFLLSWNQLVNHLDRLPIYSAGGYKPRVIIRVATPSTKPFNPQSQHDDDFTESLDLMLRTVSVVTLPLSSDIVLAYQQAMRADGSTVLVEFTDLYKDARASER